VLVNYGQMTASTRTTSNDSDRRLKTAFAPVDVQAVLAKLASLPIETWNYIADDPSVRHIGPMAQDFAAAFQVGEDDRHIHAVDGAGVAFAAIQALLGLIDEQNREIEALRDIVAGISKDLASLHSSRTESAHLVSPASAN
jgi:hypothetical protein